VRARFDEYRDTYRDAVERSISFVGAGADFFSEAKADVLLRLVRRHLGDPRDVKALDVGCGPGEMDAWLEPSLGELEGVDVSEGVIEAARIRNPEVVYSTYDGERLPFEAGSFDLVFAVCVLHHVDPARWQPFLQEMARVVRPGGLVAVLEHNPFNPLTRLAVHRCEFDDEAVLLSRGAVVALEQQAGLESAESRYILFLPWRLKWRVKLEDVLRRLPLGAQYMVAGRRPWEGEAQPIPARRRSANSGVA
jgi:SAM-dependent methyltransferase